MGSRILIIGLLLTTTSALADSWDWMRKSGDIEDRRAWQAPVPFSPKIYLKEHWWLEPQPDPQLAVKVAEVKEPGSVIDDLVWRIPTPSELPKPFETPRWVPDEAMKARALKRAYELNNNVMCCGSIDVSNDPVVTGRTVITPETEFNVLDATPVVPEKKEKKKHK